MLQRKYQSQIVTYIISPGQIETGFYFLLFFHKIYSALESYILCI